MYVYDSGEDEKNLTNEHLIEIKKYNIKFQYSNRGILL